jgi:hypothetical protein
VVRSGTHLAALGVDHTIAYRCDRWWNGLPAYDLILDAIGGASLRRRVDQATAMRTPSTPQNH